MRYWDETERRKPAKERREPVDRRLSIERRLDTREARPSSRRSVKSWLRSLTKARLGVDRRKGNERRIIDNRRSEELRSLLTPEEIADLLR